MKILAMLATAAFIGGNTLMAIAAPIDLTTWTQEGPLPNGTWTVAADGSNVFQSINGNPTYFVSDVNYINKEFNGSFEVETTGDDDYIGFVFGWNGINDYYLFDWKQLNQDYSWGMAYEGFTVSHITGPAGAGELWDHNSPNVAVLDSISSTSAGWADNTSYDFNLNYTSTGFTISIDGNQIFSETGLFSEGKFGFYNFSQSSVRYMGFEESVSPPLDPPIGAVPEPATMVLFGTGLVSLVGFRFRRKK